VDIDIVLSSEVLDYDFSENIYVYLSHDSLIDSISPLQTSQGLLFVCRFPQVVDCDFSEGTHLLLDNVQDPGNVGTIIRTAHAFGIRSVILTEGSADIYNPKTLRASMGAVFKQQVCYKSNDDIKALIKNNVKFLGTSNDIGSIDITDINLKNAIIILGNEGQGVSQDLLEICCDVINIPLSPDCESLNVAAAATIIAWEAVRGSVKCHL